MKASLVRDRSQIGLIDYGLVGMGSVMAVYSAGMSINEPSISIFSASLVFLGTLFSYVIRTLLGKTAFVTIDGILYGGSIVVTMVLLMRLNALMPMNGFPREVIMASALSWMLILGSFCSWRDGTLLFQAIPSIALFGLVGCYDTFRPVVYAFFGFLLCLATLFARTHTREMLQQAVESGWFNRADSPGRQRSVERSMALFERIKQGPWRWLAGPEWALASALAVIFVSMLGAPVIRESVREVSGNVKLPTPPVRSQIPPVVAGSSSVAQRVGQGPLGPLSEVPVFEARLDELRYLRSGTFDAYEGNGWRIEQDNGLSSPLTISDPFARRNNASLSEIKNPREFRWMVRALTPAAQIPVPPEVSAIDSRSRSRLNNRDDISGRRSPGSLEGRSVEPPDEFVPTAAVSRLPTYLLDTTSLADVPESVKRLARDVSKGARTDYERAEKIKAEIARRCMYNLRAAAVPAGADAAEHFLFSQREGYCDLFATSMVLMARSVGIPARYATGFLPSAERRTGETYVVVQADAHAWAELFFEGAGWVVFDATEGAEEVPESGRGDATVGPPWHQAAWFRTTLDVLIIVGLLGAALLFWRYQKSLPKENLERKRLEKLYTRFASRLERRSRMRRQLSETPSEFISTVRVSLGSLAGEAEKLNERFVQALFSPRSLDDEGLAKLQADLQNFEGMLRKERTPRS